MKKLRKDQQEKIKRIARIERLTKDYVPYNCITHNCTEIIVEYRMPHRDTETKAYMYAEVNIDNLEINEARIEDYNSTIKKYKKEER